MHLRREQLPLLIVLNIAIMTSSLRNLRISRCSFAEYDDHPSLPNLDVVQELDDLFSHDVQKDLSTKFYRNYTARFESSFEEDFVSIQVEKEHNLPAKRCLLPEFESVYLQGNSIHQTSHLPKLDKMGGPINGAKFISQHDLVLSINKIDLEILDDNDMNIDHSIGQPTLPARRCLLPEFRATMEHSPESAMFNYDQEDSPVNNESFDSDFLKENHLDPDDCYNKSLKDEGTDQHHLPGFINDYRYNISNILYEIRI